MGQASSAEEIGCSCGAGVIKIAVTHWRIGMLAFRREKPSPCTACGSVEIPAAEQERRRALHERESSE